MLPSFTHNLHEEIRGLRDLLSIAQIVVSAIEMAEAAQNILYCSMAALDMPAGSVVLFDEPSRTFHLKAHVGVSGPGKSWPLREGGLAQQALEGGGIVAVEDAHLTPERLSPFALQAGIRSVAAVPLTIQQQAVGVVYLDDFVPRRFCDSGLKALAALAPFASMSIDHARVHEYTCQLASTDGLTGLYNYRMFRHMVKDELSRMSRYRKPMSLILYDLDNFKLFNDTYGHPAGDKALKATAEILRESLRECDILFRCGGEEFIALLPETDIEEALVAAERSRFGIEAKSAQYLKEITDCALTVSVGVASYPRDGLELEALLQRLDDHLYTAKRRGKNLVHYVRQGIDAPSWGRSALHLG